MRRPSIPHCRMLRLTLSSIPRFSVSKRLRSRAAAASAAASVTGSRQVNSRQTYAVASPSRICHRADKRHQRRERAPASLRGSHRHDDGERPVAAARPRAAARACPRDRAGPTMTTCVCSACQAESPASIIGTTRAAAPMRGPNRASVRSAFSTPVAAADERLEREQVQDRHGAGGRLGAVVVLLEPQQHARIAARSC